MRVHRFVHAFYIAAALAVLPVNVVHAQGDSAASEQLDWSPSLPPVRTAPHRSQRDASPASELRVSAQGREPGELRWALEVHGGGLRNGRPRSGRSSLPSTGALVGGRISVASFLFGDGARLFNENQAGVPGHAVIAPLDPVLGGPALQRRRGTGTVGARVSRAFRHRFTAELALDYDRGVLTLTESALAGIEATRASTEVALQQMLSAATVPSGARVSATVHDQASLSQVAATGALLVHIEPIGAITPFVALGGGVVFNRIAEGPSATLTGRYELGASGEIVGTDVVRLHFSLDDIEYAGIVGGGLKYAVATRWGIRLDARARISPNRIVNLVDVTPGIALQSSGSPYPLLESGALQFSSTDPLTGGPLVNATAFTGTGLRAQVSIVAGLFWRF